MLEIFVNILLVLVITSGFAMVVANAFFGYPRKEDDADN